MNKYEVRLTISVGETTMPPQTVDVRAFESFDIEHHQLRGVFGLSVHEAESDPVFTLGCRIMDGAATVLNGLIEGIVGMAISSSGEYRDKNGKDQTYALLVEVSQAGNPPE